MHKICSLIAASLCLIAFAPVGTAQALDESPAAKAQSWLAFRAAIAGDLAAERLDKPQDQAAKQAANEATTEALTEALGLLNAVPGPLAALDDHLRASLAAIARQPLAFKLGAGDREAEDNLNATRGDHVPPRGRLNAG